MKVEIQDAKCIVTRQAGDPKFYGVVGAAGESRLLHHVKLALQTQGFDFVKKRMHHDGHLVDDLQQYLRERKRTGKRCLAIYNPTWAIAGAEEDYNQTGRVVLLVHDLGRSERGKLCASS